jgi:hypothetical protein
MTVFIVQLPYSGSRGTHAAEEWQAPSLIHCGGWLVRRGREAAATGGAEGGRTPDLLIANEALSQLSYGPAKCNRTVGGCECGPLAQNSYIRGSVAYCRTSRRYCPEP